MSDDESSKGCRLLFRSKEKVEVFDIVNKEDGSENSNAGKGVCLAKGLSSIHAVHPDGEFALIHMNGLGVIRRDLN
eukprot:6911658-Ditylum_brightwellii.AAC.1